jgi:hypothetical protein
MKDVESRQGDDYSFDKGDLTYEELKEAVLQFEGNISNDNRRTLLFYLMWAYNDKYNREGMDIVEPSDEERGYIDAVIKEIMEGYELRDLFIAELYREREMFEEALEILETCSYTEDYLIEIIEKMKVYAKNKSRIAFLR